MSELYSAAILLLKDIYRIQSYDNLIETSVSKLTERGSLDILVLHKITRLNTLDQVLSEIYALATEIIQKLGKNHIDVRVLYNDYYKEIEVPIWDLLVLDSSSDSSFDSFSHENKASLGLLDIERSTSEPKTIGLIRDESDESSHEVTAVGGTFDHFHDGHKILLTAAAFVTRTKLIVGVTDQELLVNKKFKEFLQSYQHRVDVLQKFLNHIKPNLNIAPIAIRDVCGPTGYIENIDSLVVSRETVAGAKFVNDTRRAKGFHELVVHVINVLGGQAEDGFQNKLSSTQFRKDQFEASKEKQIH